MPLRSNLKQEKWNMLEVIGLSKKYGKTVAAEDIRFAVPDGRIGILLGPNGAGKSTVIKSIAGLLRFQGAVRIQGMDARTLEAKRCFAYVPELPYMYDALTVREHIEFITRAYAVEVSEEERNHLLEQFELADKQEKLGNELSKGMMQKVSICCALVIRPKVILLDEPMVGLDPTAIKELKRVLLELREKGCTILISTHMLEMVKELWDVTFVMDKGHILGTYARESLGNEDLEELYFSVTGQTAQKAQPGETAQSGQKAQSGEAAQSGQKAQPGETAQCGQTMQSGEAAQSGQKTQSGEAAQSGQKTQSGEAAQSGQKAQPGQDRR